MSETTAAVLQQINALSEHERRELLQALSPQASKTKITAAGLDKIQEALAWRYEGGVDDAARSDQFRSPPRAEVSTADLDELYDALDWRYEGGPDDAARIDELQR